MAKYGKTDYILGGFCAIPRNRYTVRILKAEKNIAKTSGNPKAQLTCEIIAPEHVEINGETYAIAGRQFVIHQTLVPNEPWGVGQLIKGLQKAGFDFKKFNEEEELDDDKLVVLEKFCFDILLSSEENKQTRPPTEEEKAEGKNELQPILDGEGKEIKLGWNIRANLQEVVGPASVKTENPAWA
jgi:hypothetical protein